MVATILVSIVRLAAKRCSRLLIRTSFTGTGNTALALALNCRSRA